MSYEESLETLGIPSQEDRKKRGDMITTYKCTLGEGFTDKSGFIKFSTHKMQGHSFKLQKKMGTKNVKKYSFPNRAINGWNNLPESVVGAQTISSFKGSYDNFVSQKVTLLTHIIHA